MAFHVGYMGYAKVGSTIIRITGSGLNPVQAINAPELVQGEYNKRAWNYGPIETSGNITGPLGEISSPSLTAYAWDRDNAVGDKMNNVIDVELYFYKSSGNSGRKFSSCQINSYALSVTAGEVCTFTVDFFGTTVTAVGPASFNTTACEKLITWDKCGVTGLTSPNISDEIQGWSLTINNNLKRIMRVGQPDLFPVEILAGIRDITGTLTIYASDANSALLTKLNAPPYFGADSYDDYTASTPVTLIFNAGNAISIDIKCYFQRTEANATLDTMQYTANFTGLCNDYTTVI